MSTGGLDAVLTHGDAGRPAGPRAPGPVLSVADAEGAEGGTLAFRVTLAPAASGPVTVAYATADGPSANGAAAGEDYTAASGTLAFKPGETEKTVAVAVAGDVLGEGAETLTLALSDATGASIGDGEATGTIGASAGPAALTASFLGVPPEHDGQDPFTVELRFSEEPQRLSYRTVRDSLFAVSGGKGNDKGKVEGLVGFIRRNFLVPVPRVESIEALNDDLAGQCRRRQAARPRGHGETIGERLARDREALLALPPAPCDACDKRPGRVSSRRRLGVERRALLDQNQPTNPARPE